MIDMFNFHLKSYFTICFLFLLLLSFKNNLSWYELYLLSLRVYVSSGNFKVFLCLVIYNFIDYILSSISLYIIYQLHTVNNDKFSIFLLFSFFHSLLFHLILSHFSEFYLHSFNYIYPFILDLSASNYLLTISYQRWGNQCSSIIYNIPNLFPPNIFISLLGF